MSDIVLEIKNLTAASAAVCGGGCADSFGQRRGGFRLARSNGAGKTPRSKMLTRCCRLLGEARVAGFSITTQAVSVRRAIGYVPQAVSVDGSLTGYENLLIFAKLYDLHAASSKGASGRHWNSWA